MQSPSNNAGQPSNSADPGSTTGTASSGGTSSEIRSDVRQLGKTAGHRIHSEVDARKGAAAQQAKSVSAAIGQAAGQLDEGAPQWLKSAFQQGAQQAQRFADALEQKDSRQILSDIQTMARDNPGTFLAGCAALGFVAARVLKAGAPDNSPSGQQQKQFPPPQVDEPMFGSGAEPASATSPAGEFA